MAKHYKTVGAIINHFGGLKAFAMFCGGLKETAVWNWRVRGFPPELYRSLNDRLVEHGVIAPPSLWKQRDLPPPQYPKLEAAE
jgi:hypothetical protein